MNSPLSLLCSTGAFSRFPDQSGYDSIIKYGPQLNVDGFEVMYYPSWYSDITRVASILKETGLYFPVVHADKNIGVALGKATATEREQGLQWLEANCQFSSIIGAKLVVLHLWGWPELDDDMTRNLSTLHQCHDLAFQYGLKIALETIPCRRSTPITNIVSAIAHDQRSLVTLDTEFLYNHQQLDEIFTVQHLWQEQRICHIHIKDSNGQPFADGKRRYLHPGDGNIDFETFFAQLFSHNFTGHISLESPAIDAQKVVDIPRLQASIDFLRALLQQTISLLSN